MQVTQKLKRSVPEEQGISSAGILAFIEAIEMTKTEIHSFMIVRHGYVVSEGWWSPYQAELNHQLNSISKSLTSTAVGIAIEEKLLAIDDQVISFFLKDMPETVGENLAAMQVRDLLIMSTGHAEDTTRKLVDLPGENWVKKFFSLPVDYKPGTHFLYNTGATYILSAILQKVTGQTLMEYLQPRIFEPLGIERTTWRTCPRGIALGGAGWCAKTEDIAKLGLLYLQKGVWNEEQILAREWVEEATAFQVPSALAIYTRERENNDYAQGYGYQFWRNRHGSYRASGAFSQFSIVMPYQNAVIAITGNSADSHDVLDSVWEHLLPAMHDSPIQSDGIAYESLQLKLSTLELFPPRYFDSTKMVEEVCGKYFELEENEMGAEGVSFGFNQNSCTFILQHQNKEHSIPCGNGNWIEGNASIPLKLPNLFEQHDKSNPILRIAASGTWKDENTYCMTWRYIETPNYDTIVCHFNRNRLEIEFLSSTTALFPSTDSRPILKGRRMN